MGLRSLRCQPILMKTLCIATRNAHKVQELGPVLAPFWTVKCTADYAEMTDIDIEETGDTFLANATLKAVATSQVVPDHVLADDSGLECDALNGAPGIFSARYGGIPSSTERNNCRLLEELERAGAVTPEQRAARFRCVLVLAKEGAVVASFEGTCEGAITTAAKGTNGFGYDPLFIPKDYTWTFGQLSEKTKLTLSHRGMALKRFLAWCKANPIE
jgi:XTP/dITP diphosphohydrolase